MIPLFPILIVQLRSASAGSTCCSWARNRSDSCCSNAEFHVLGTVPGRVKVEEDDAPGSPHVEPDSSMLLEGMRSARIASSREMGRAVLMKSRIVDATDAAEDDGMFTYWMVASFVCSSRMMRPADGSIVAQERCELAKSWSQNLIARLLWWRVCE